MARVFPGIPGNIAGSAALTRHQKTPPSWEGSVCLVSLARALPPQSQMTLDNNQGYK
jgi:hypothetical protein